MKRSSWFNLIIVFLLTIAAGLVFVTSILTTIYYDMHEDVDFPHYTKENYVALGVSVAIFLLVFFIAYWKKVFHSDRTCIIVGLLFCAVYCLTLIFAIRPLPVDDAKLLDGVIRQFMEGDYSSLTQKGGYLYIWPFQLGYVLFGQTMTRIFGAGNYIAWDIVQMFSILITVYLLYRITWELFGNRVICGIMAIMSMGMLFFYNFVVFVYGDILSMAPQTLALFFILLYIKRGDWWYVLLSAPFIAIAVLLKTNCEIALIAMVMGIFFSPADGDKTKRLVKKLVLSAILVATVFAAKYGVNRYYCNLVGIDEIPSGSPTVSHIVMGISESELEDGWYNAYNYNVFAANGYDTEATKVAAMKDLKERLDLFIHHPRFTAKYFIRKFLTQWADPVCISTHVLDTVSRHVENQPALCDYIVFGNGRIALSWIMNVYMTVCYLGVLVYLLGGLRNGGVSKAELLILVFIFGGIMFHEFWEGSSRYAMRYYVYWIPFAAYGIEALIGKLARH